MTKQQNNIVSSWIIGPATGLLALRVENYGGYSWVFVLLVGFGFCRYLRRECPKDTSKWLEGVSNKTQLIMFLYYASLSPLSVYIVVNHPDTIDYSDGQFLVFLFAITLPFIPGWLRWEYKLYQWAGNSAA